MDWNAQGQIAGLYRSLGEEQGWRQTCTCPVCQTVWQHKASPAWIREHFGSQVGPVTCPECGTQSVPGKKIGPRKVYVEPTPEPVLTRTERPRKLGWFRRPLDPATQPQPKQKGASEDYDYQR